MHRWAIFIGTCRNDPNIGSFWWYRTSVVVMELDCWGKNCSVVVMELHCWGKNCSVVVMELHCWKKNCSVVVMELRFILSKMLYYCYTHITHLCCFGTFSTVFSCFETFHLLFCDLLYCWAYFLKKIKKMPTMLLEWPET